jgi:hypothetical protein
MNNITINSATFYLSIIEKQIGCGKTSQAKLNEYCDGCDEITRAISTPSKEQYAILKRCTQLKKDIMNERKH